MQKQNTFNGWANYATWMVALHFGDNWGSFFNDQDEYEDMFESCEDKEDVQATIEQYIRNDIEMYLDQLNLENQTDIFLMDVVSYFTQDIDYLDLAEHYVDDVFDCISLELATV